MSARQGGPERITTQGSMVMKARAKWSRRLPATGNMAHNAALGTTSKEQLGHASECASASVGASAASGHTAIATVAHTPTPGKIRSDLREARIENVISKKEDVPAAGQAEMADRGSLLHKLDLPEEVTTRQAAEVLGCSKHTVLQYLEEGLLEWRNTAPPSSDRPVYRITLRSVLELRLGYRRGARPAVPLKPIKQRRRTPSHTAFKPKHLRREKHKPKNGDGAAEV
jgi:hypothetical protein